MAELQPLPKEAVQDFVSFVTARHALALRKARGLPKPWTEDPILQQYRFCNVYRELDTVTQWVRQNWSFDDPDQWFAMVVARLVNWPDTLKHLSPLPWHERRFAQCLADLGADGSKVYGPAYIVSTNGHTMPKHLYLAQRVLTPIWQDRLKLRPSRGDTLQAWHAQLMRYQGMGSFMAAQVVADVKNTPGSPLSRAHTTDWMTWCAPGPGSTRGLNRILGRGAVRTGLNGRAFQHYVNRLRGEVNTHFHKRNRNGDWPALCAQDTQNCLCEFDKYERVRLGEGTPRMRYAGTP